MGPNYWVIGVLTSLMVTTAARSQELLSETFPPHVGRPDPQKWAAVANAAGADEVWHYRQNAKKLGLTIFVGYPVPSNEPSEVTAWMGYKGIYVLRSQAAHLGRYDLNPW